MKLKEFVEGFIDGMSFGYIRRWVSKKILRRLQNDNNTPR